MSITDDLLSALTDVTKHNSGSLEYISSSVKVTSSCYVSFSPNQDLPMELVGYDTEYPDFSVLVKSSNVSDWGLETNSFVSLDSQQYSGSYQVWKPLNKNGAYWMIPLKTY